MPAPTGIIAQLIMFGSTSFINGSTPEISFLTGYFMLYKPISIFSPFLSWLRCLENRIISMPICQNFIDFKTDFYQPLAHFLFRTHRHLQRFMIEISKYGLRKL